MTTSPALLIAGHGTRDEGGADALRALVRLLAERHPEVPVAGGFFGAPASPLPLSDAVDGLVERGADRLAVIPLLTAPTGPVPEELPTVLARASERHPGLTHVCGAELGPHPAARRTGAAAGPGTGQRRPQARGPGPHHGAAGGPRRDRSVRQCRGGTGRAAVVEGRGFAGVETAFVSQAAPDVPAGLDRCRALAGAGEPGRIVVLPYFLLPGGPVERLHMQAEGWAAAHPGTDVFGATVIGPEPEVADVIMERYRAAVAGEPPFASAPCGCRAAAEDARQPHGAAWQGASLTAGAGDR